MTQLPPYWRHCNWECKCQLFVTVLMDISAMSYMILAHTLLIILSKNILQGLSKTGVQSKFLLSCFHIAWLMTSFRCTALPTDLNGFANSHSQWLHKGWVQELDSQTLWDEYGIDDDIIVGHSLLHLQCTSFLQSHLAIYIPFSTSWHSWIVVCRSAAPAHQGNFQGPSCSMGWQLPLPQIWQGLH